MTVTIRAIHPDDAGEVLTLQRAAFVDDAILYDDPSLPVMTQTLEQVEAELADNLGCVAEDEHRIVGAARARRDGPLLLIGRIAVAPDRQGDGIGSALLDALERQGLARGCAEAELFTGSRNVANIELYEGLGYAQTQRVDQGDGTQQVFLRKRLDRRDRTP